jgi:hypothetical protein
MPRAPRATRGAEARRHGKFWRVHEISGETRGELRIRSRKGKKLAVLRLRLSLSFLSTFETKLNKLFVV